QARRYSYTASPLTRVINFLIQILTYTALALCLLYLAVYLLGGYAAQATLEYPRLSPRRLAEAEERLFVRMVAATITSMVPQGLVLMATLAFTIGAVVMSMRGAVVQRLHAVEAMASVDVVCTDKTGTLTTNLLKLDQVVPLAEGDAEVRR